MSKPYAYKLPKKLLQRVDEYVAEIQEWYGKHKVKRSAILHMLITVGLEKCEKRSDK